LNVFGIVHLITCCVALLLVDKPSKADGKIEWLRYTAFIALSPGFILATWALVKREMNGG